MAERVCCGLGVVPHHVVAPKLECQLVDLLLVDLPPVDICHVVACLGCSS